jgi:hypothetical protein
MELRAASTGFVLNACPGADAPPERWVAHGLDNKPLAEVPLDRPSGNRRKASPVRATWPFCLPGWGHVAVPARRAVTPVTSHPYSASKAQPSPIIH